MPASTGSPTTRRAPAAATTSTRSSPRALPSEPVGFELRFQLAGPDDALDDPTAVWPEERESVTAGRLELTESASDPERDGHIDVFDPNRIVDGIELSEDPILRIRHDAYSVSAYARWDD